MKINYKDSIPGNFTGIVAFTDGEKEWYKEGKIHREDDPAVEYSDGRKAWYKEGKRHRLDGPAFEYPDGYKEWWIEGNFYSPGILSELINSSLFLGKEKGRYNLEWLKFLTEKGIDEFPFIPGMKEYKIFNLLFQKLEKNKN